MSTRLELEFNAINNAITVYSRTISDFETLVSTLDTSMNALEASNWKSSASAAFFRRYEERWKRNMENHKSTIATLRDALDKAREQYNQLYDSIPQINQALNR